MNAIRHQDRFSKIPWYIRERQIIMVRVSKTFWSRYANSYASHHWQVKNKSWLLVQLRWHCTVAETYQDWISFENEKNSNKCHNFKGRSIACHTLAVTVTTSHLRHSDPGDPHGINARHSWLRLPSRTFHLGSYNGEEHRRQRRGATMSLWTYEDDAHVSIYHSPNDNTSHDSHVGKFPVYFSFHPQIPPETRRQQIRRAAIFYWWVFYVYSTF